MKMIKNHLKDQDSIKIVTSGKYTGCKISVVESMVKVKFSCVNTKMCRYVFSSKDLIERQPSGQQPRHQHGESKESKDPKNNNSRLSSLSSLSTSMLAKPAIDYSSSFLEHKDEIESSSMVDYPLRIVSPEKYRGMTCMLASLVYNAKVVAKWSSVAGDFVPITSWSSASPTSPALPTSFGKEVFVLSKNTIRDINDDEELSAKTIKKFNTWSNKEDEGKNSNNNTSFKGNSKNNRKRVNENNGSKKPKLTTSTSPTSTSSTLTNPISNVWVNNNIVNLTSPILTSPITPSIKKELVISDVNSSSTTLSPMWLYEEAVDKKEFSFDLSDMIEETYQSGQCAAIKKMYGQDCTLMMRDYYGNMLADPFVLSNDNVKRRIFRSLVDKKKMIDQLIEKTVSLAKENFYPPFMNLHPELILKWTQSSSTPFWGNSFILPPSSFFNDFKKMLTEEKTWVYKYTRPSSSTAPANSSSDQVPQLLTSNNPVISPSSSSLPSNEVWKREIEFFGQLSSDIFDAFVKLSRAIENKNSSNNNSSSINPFPLSSSLGGFRGASAPLIVPFVNPILWSSLKAFEKGCRAKESRRNDHKISPVTNTVIIDQRILFHGTSEQIADGILENGFIREYGSRKIHGDGNYFAVDPTYSMDPSFATINPQTGKQTIILAQVIVGRKCEYRQTDNDKLGALLPRHISSIPGDRAESFVDNLNDTKIVCCTNNCQSYPLFKVTF
jgi:hypothetical protein